MIETEPKSLAFSNVRIKQCYSSSLCITNTLSTPVDISLRASSPHISIQPTKVHIAPQSSIVATVKLTLTQPPTHRQSTQYIYIKSLFFDQKVPVDVTVAPSDRHSRSPSPARRDALDTSGGPSGYLNSTMRSGVADESQASRARPAVSPSRERDGARAIRELQMQLQVKDEKIRRLEHMVGHLEASHPNFDALVRMKLEEQKLSFEEKSSKVRAACPPPLRCCD